MCSLLKSLSFPVLLLLLTGLAHAQTETNGAREQLAKLDKIITKAKNLDAFLADEKIQTLYFKGLQDYYGKDKFDRPTYDAILKQLKNVNSKIPGFGARLWETTNIGQHFEITTSLKTSGRSLQEKKWNEHFESWKEKIEESSGRITNDDVFITKLKEYDAKYKKEYEQLGAETTKLGKLESKIKMADFFKRYKEMPETNELASYLLQKYLAEDLNTEAFHSGDADIILDAMDNLRQNAKIAVTTPTGTEELPSSVLTKVRDLIPQKEDLLRKEEIFPIQMRKTRTGNVAVGSGAAKTYTFDPVPRRIHGIWKGVSIGECVGGGNIKSLTPERWATVALTETQLHNVHEGRSYLGFVQMVPIKKGDQIYGSVDFGSGALTRKTVTIGREGQKNSSTLFEHWYKNVKPTLPKKWAGLVVSDSDAISNAGALPTVRGSPKYKIGTMIGTSKQFQRIDPMGSEIVKLSPRNEHSVIYGGRMIFDGMVKDAKEMRMLVNADPKLTENIRKILAGLKNGTPAYQNKIIQLLSGTKRIENQELNDLIFKLAKAPEKETREAAAKIVLQNEVWTEKLGQQKAYILLHEQNFNNKELWLQFAENHFTDPKLTEEAMELLTNITWGPRKQVIPYLSHAQLDDVTLKKIRSLVKNHDPSAPEALEILGHQEKDRGLLKELMVSRWKHLPKDEDGGLHLYQQYIKYFGQDQQSDDWLLQTIQKNAKTSLDDADELLVEIEKNLNNPKIRSQVMQLTISNPERLSLHQPELVKSILTHSPTPSEIQQIMEESPSRFFVDVLEKLEPLHENPTKFSFAVLRSYIDDGSDEDYGERLHNLLRRMSADEKAALYENIREGFDHRDAFFKVKGETNSVRNAHLRSIIEMMGAENFEIPKDIQLKALAYLKNNEVYDFGHTLRNFDLKNPEINFAIQKIYATESFGFAKAEDAIPLIREATALHPDFKKEFQKKLKSFTTTDLDDPDHQFSEKLKTLFNEKGKTRGCEMPQLLRTIFKSAD